jgi:TPR repeat protein
MPAAPPSVADPSSAALPAVEADASDPEAVFAQAKAYRDATGVPGDDNKAFDLFRQAAAQGHAGAQYYLGLTYAQGRGTAADEAQAAQWLERAARRNVVDAQYLVCLSYALGRGVERDPVAAHAWCEIASRRGSDKAPEALGKLDKVLGPLQRRRAREMAVRLTQEIRATTPVMVGPVAANAR